MAYSCHQLLITLSLIYVINAQSIVGVLTTAQKQYILDMHNDIRNTVADGNYAGNGGLNLPGARNMNELLWV